MTAGQQEEERQPPLGISTKDARELVGKQVTITVAIHTQFWISKPESFTGRVIALGQKYGNGRSQRPWCLVVACGDGRVPIIALRSIVDVQTAEVKPHIAAPAHDDRALCRHCGQPIYPTNREQSAFRHVQRPARRRNNRG